MTVEERLHELGSGLEGQIGIDYRMVEVAYGRQRRRRTAAATILTLAVVAGASAAAVFVRIGPDRTPVIGQPSKLAITAQSVGATGRNPRPAGLQGHFVVLTPSAAIIAAGRAAPCPSFITDPTIEAFTLRMRYEGSTSPRCNQDVDPRPSWAPILLLLNRPVFDNVSRIVVADDSGKSRAYKPTTIESIDAEGLPAVVAVRVTSAGTQPDALLLYNLRGTRAMYEGRVNLATDGEYELVAPRAPGHYRVVLSSAGKRCGTAVVRVQPGAAATVDLSCA
jgi:hypothetical protein